MVGGDAGCDTRDRSRRNAWLLGILRESAGSATYPDFRRSSLGVAGLQFEIAGLLANLLLRFAQRQRFKRGNKRKRTVAEYCQGE